MLAIGRAVYNPTVFIVDDDPAFGDTFSRLISRMGVAVEVYKLARSFIDRFDTRRCGCVLLDLRMPEMGGLAVQDALAARGAMIPVIIVTGFADVAAAVRAFRKGAVDFLEKPVDADLLCESVRRAVELDARLRRRRSQAQGATNRLASLTPRESQVLDGVVAGLANKQIALCLGITEKTVEVHRARIRAKTQARHVPGLVRLALLGKRTTAEPLGHRGEVLMHGCAPSADEMKAGVGQQERHMARMDTG